MFDFHGYGPSIFKGAIITIEVGFLSLILALLLGLLGASAKLSNNPVSRGVGTLYTTIIRGVPDLVLMMLIYFGGQVLINNFTDWLFVQFEIDIFINIDQFVAGVIAIGFIFGAYMTETFRGAFLAVDKGQIEAGYAYGMSKWQVFTRVMFPQMMRHALPGLGNNWLVMLKTTALVSVIGLADMVRLATEASKAVHQPFKFFIPVVLVYLALTTVSEWFIKTMERRYSTGVVKG
ncbi:ABC transporter permease [Hahella ganghwensis]|uniref:ABC transporter permease n=1 Tax=Hahella ganghwensis TaxID=286420 RepID=UPI0004769CD1|nr:ABC transporter permease [Hahella ganghwensis]